MKTLASKFGLQIDVRPVARGIVSDAVLYAAVGAAVYAALRTAHAPWSDEIGGRDENYCVCMAALAVAVAAWLA